MYIPDGFTTVVPYLFVENAEDYIEFLILAFEAEEIGRSLRPDRKIANAQIRIGTAILMVSEAQGPYTSFKSSYYLYVEDVDEAMERSLKNGATMEMKVGEMPYGDRQGGVIDPAGNIWWLSQRLIQEPYF